MRFLGEWYTAIQQKPAERIKAAERMKVRGVIRAPQAPRDVFLQSGPRGVLINWRPPQVNPDIAGWRIYKDTEASLFAEIHEPNTTQHFIEATAGSTPPVGNFFISAINKLGVESPIIQVQGAATTEASAPTMPSTPPTYTAPYTSVKGAPQRFQGL